MQDDPLEDVIEDDDFLSDKNVVTTPAPGKNPGTYVEASNNSGIFPNNSRDGISYTGQRFSAFTTFSLFACLIVMVISAIFLICMFFGYV